MNHAFFSPSSIRLQSRPGRRHRWSLFWFRNFGLEIIQRRCDLRKLALLHVGSSLITLSCIKCSRLRARLHDEVSFPGSKTYQSEQNGTDGYWAVNEAVVTPACRISPKSSEGVSLAIREFSHLKCPFAIRGGGHMWWAGAANIQDGVTLDLSSMNQVEVSKDRTFTSVGGGARWEDVYLPLDAMNLSVVGGRVSTVGVGGLTTGGTVLKIDTMRHLCLI